MVGGVDLRPRPGPGLHPGRSRLKAAGVAECGEIGCFIADMGILLVVGPGRLAEG